MVKKTERCIGKKSSKFQFKKLILYWQKIIRVIVQKLKQILAKNKNSYDSKQLTVY